MKDKSKKRCSKGRMDFIQKIESFKDNVDGSVTFRAILIPDPKRYEKLVVDGKDVYKDKFTDLIIPVDVIKKACEKVSIENPVPIYFSPPKLENPCDFLKEKREELLNNWDKEIVVTNESKSIDSLLGNLCGKETLFSILYVDLEGSTELSYALSSEDNEKIVKIFLNKMIEVIDLYRGYILKISGDCVIGIFPSEVNAPNACDNCVQAAITMRSIIEDVINPIFSSKQFPQIGYHIGMDIGKVKITNIGFADVASFIDVIGYPMNLTSKIQAYASHNEILMGKELFSNIHCGWQEKCCRKKLGDPWKMKDPWDENKLYDLFSVDVKWDCKSE